MNRMQKADREDTFRRVDALSRDDAIDLLNKLEEEFRTATGTTVPPRGCGREGAPETATAVVSEEARRQFVPTLAEDVAMNTERLNRLQVDTADFSAAFRKLEKIDAQLSKQAEALEATLAEERLTILEKRDLVVHGHIEQLDKLVVDVAELEPRMREYSVVIGGALSRIGELERKVKTAGQDFNAQLDIGAQDTIDGINQRITKLEIKVHKLQGPRF